MNCPDTRLSVISGMLNQENKLTWQNSWKTFHDIYSNTMIAMAKNQFAKVKWNNISDEDIEEVISNSVLSIMKTFEQGKYEKGYKFRGFLKKVISRRVFDYMRSKNKNQTIGVESTEILDFLSETNSDDSNEFLGELEDEEYKAYRAGIVLDAWENIRPTISPQTALIFELIHIEGKSHKEVASELWVERNVIDGALHRVMKKLKAKLAEEDYRKELER